MELQQLLQRLTSGKSAEPLLHSKEPRIVHLVTTLTMMIDHSRCLCNPIINQNRAGGWGRGYVLGKQHTSRERDKSSNMRLDSRTYISTAEQLISTTDSFKLEHSRSSASAPPHHLVS